MVFQREVWKMEVELRVKEALDVPRAGSEGQPVPLRGLQEVQVCAAAGRIREGSMVRQDAKRRDIAGSVGSVGLGRIVVPDDCDYEDYAKKIQGCKGVTVTSKRKR